VDELAAVAARFNVARAHVGQLDVARSILSQFIELYRSSDEVSFQALDDEDAYRIEEGDPPERPPMWSTKQVTPDAHGGPWIASNGRWYVRPLAPVGWRLERRFGGRWAKEADGRWVSTVEPLIRLTIDEEFHTNWDGLWLALQIDYWEEIAPEAFSRVPHVEAMIRRQGEPSFRYVFETGSRYVTVVTDGDQQTYHLDGDPDRRFRTLDPATPLHRAIERAAVGETVMVDAPRPYPVTIVGIEGTPPDEAAD
jgi:hypothetical protein